MAPDAAFSNISDKNEFTKFAKFLAYKGVQVIVESRKGVKIGSNSKHITSDSDWFNLQIPDSPEVNQATKTALPSDRILETIRSKLHVEISVQTEDGDEMVLELWTLELDETQFDTSLKAMNTVYFRMGILLKSLITITRITPAYHLSRKQRTESFTIFYRVYNGEPKVNALGESVKKIQAGLLKTPLGGLCFTVSYRTNFSISPNRSDKSKMLLLKSDHFELSPKHIIFESKKKKENKEKEFKVIKAVDLNKPLRLAAFVDENIVRQAFEEFFRKIPTPKCRAKRIQEKPMSKSTQDLDTTTISRSPTFLEMPPKKFSGFRNENEPPLKLLHFPFADAHPIRELAEFYKEFFNAPYLKLTDDLKQARSKSTESLNEDIELASEDLSKDLELYESSVQEFDDLLADMCRSAEWSGN